MVVKTQASSAKIRHPPNVTITPFISIPKARMVIKLFYEETSIRRLTSFFLKIPPDSFSVFGHDATTLIKHLFIVNTTESSSSSDQHLLAS